MKKTLQNLIFTASLFAAFISAAQPTLTEANIAPVIGDQYTENITGYVSPGTSGANQTWNLSSMTSSSSSTTNAVSVSSTTYGSSFPSATIAFSASGNVSYEKISATAEQNYGIVQGGTTVIAYSNPEDILRFPFAYTNTYTDPWATTYVSSGYTYYRAGTTAVTADGYGTLKLPSGTYSNVMRVHFVQNYQDSTNISGNPIIITYQNDEYMWYLANNHSPIATVNTFTANGSPSQSGTYLNNITTGIAENSMLTGFNLYPNPASTELNVNVSLAANKKVEINLLNVLGESVGTTIIADGLQGNNTYQVNTSNLSAGIYFAQIMLDGKLISAKRFIVSKN
ncbi:MAG: T9SS type A sorting domain-containing protein [Bacteroidia bacterium]